MKNKKYKWIYKNRSKTDVEKGIALLRIGIYNSLLEKIEVRELKEW